MDGSNDVVIMEQESGDRKLTITLTISPTAPSDATDYVCVAENVVDVDEMISNLTVYGMCLSYMCNVCCDNRCIMYMLTYSDSNGHQCVSRSWSDELHCE